MFKLNVTYGRGRDAMLHCAQKALESRKPEQDSEKDEYAYSSTASLMRKVLEAPDGSSIELEVGEYAAYLTLKNMAHQFLEA